jgi:GDP-mannose 6-dehydrogenase
MRISIFGLGYVGCVSAACLAQNGHEVLGLDVNLQKAELISSGRAPVIEQGLDNMIQESVKRGSLQVVFDSQSAIHNSDISMICVGTPSNKNGSLDLQYVKNVCHEIGTGLADKHDYHVVVVRSTILPGKTEEILIPLLEHHSGRRAGLDFGVCMNPEFLREGNAVADYYDPGLIIIGELDQRSGEYVEALYKEIDAPATRTTIRVAEMIKYANNAFHALKVVFANEIGILCKFHKIDGREVMEILCKDTRLNISSAYLRPGFAFGGSCLPKDLRAVLYRAKERDLDCHVLNATLASNQRHIQYGIELIENTGSKKIGVLGLSFKNGTDDMRESPVVSLVERLIGKGYNVYIYDEEVELGRLVGTNKAFLEREIPHIASLMCSSIEEVLDQVDVVVVTHGGDTFRGVLPLIREDQTLIDLVGIASDKRDIRGAYEGICW